MDYVLADDVRYRREWFGSVVVSLSNKTTHFYNRTATYVIEQFFSANDEGSVQNSLPDVSITEAVDLLFRESILKRVAPGQSSSRASIFNTHTVNFQDGVFYSPLGIEIELTRRCLRKCAYCAYDSSPTFSVDGELTIADWTNVLDTAASDGVLFVRFTGGDPFLKDGAFDLFNAASDRGLLVTVGSDLTRFDAAMAKQLAAIPNLYLLQTTLDGPDSKSANQLRGKNNFTRVIEGTKLLRSFGIPFVIGMVVTKLNFDKVASTAALAEELGATHFIASPLYDAGRGRSQSDLIPSREQMSVAARQYADCTFAVRTPSRFATSDADSEIGEEYPSDDWSYLPATLRGSDRFLRIDPQGNAYPSIKVASEIGDAAFAGNVKKSSVGHIWRTSEILQGVRSATAKHSIYGPLVTVDDVVENLRRLHG